MITLNCWAVSAALALWLFGIDYYLGRSFFTKCEKLSFYLFNNWQYQDERDDHSKLLKQVSPQLLYQKINKNDSWLQVLNHDKIKTNGDAG